MPKILDNLNLIKKIDRQDVAGSITLLPAQIAQVLEDARAIKVPRAYAQANKVVISGMGGSNLGGEILKSVFADIVKAPILIHAGYEVPAFVDKNTLYILSSYSGTTEEPLSGYREAKKRGAKIMGITANAKSDLAQLMRQDKIPGYIYEDKNNPCNVPRYGVGYAVFGLMALLARAGLLKIRKEEVEKIIRDLTAWNRRLEPTVGFKNNAAKKIAAAMRGRETALIAAEFLQGSTHTFRNQLCETGKNFASYLLLPDLNHFAMEGLAFPRANRKNLFFFFLDSKLYHPRVQIRSRLTKEVVKKNRIKFSAHALRGSTKLEQAFELLQLGSWASFYLAVLNGANPAPNLWVDWFKKELGK